MKFKWFSMALALGGLFTTAAAAENPVYKLFPDNITFHLSFDEGNCLPDMANGQAKPMNIKGKPVFKPGVFGGKALEQGRVLYKAPKNFDMTKSGSLIIWLAPLNWPKEMPKDKKEPGFRAFMAFGPESFFCVTKIFNQPWKYHGHLNNYVQYRKAIPHINCILFNEGRALSWPNGKWRMLVATWGNGMFTNSVDGKKSKISYMKPQLTQQFDWFEIGATDPARPELYLTDEVVVLDKALTDAEIAQLYQASQALIKPAK